MDVNRYPTGSRVDVWWSDDNEWYTATVLKTRTMSHNIDDVEISCGELFCHYDLDQHMDWLSLHNSDVRLCTSPFSAEDTSGVPDPFNTGSRVDVWWPGDSCWYVAVVLTTRTTWHTIKRTKTLCREIFCEYELDGLMQWHSLHNNNVRSASGVCISLFPLPVHIQTQCDTQNTHKNNATRDKTRQ